jgi:hypothetical protein
MTRSVAGAFHVSTDGKSGWPNGVVKGQIVDIPEEDARRYAHHDVALVELLDDETPQLLKRFRLRVQRDGTDAWPHKLIRSLVFMVSSVCFAERAAGSTTRARLSLASCRRYPGFCM